MAIHSYSTPKRPESSLRPLAQAIALALSTAGLIPAAVRADLTQTFNSGLLTASVSRVSTLDNNNVLTQGTPVDIPGGRAQIPFFSSKTGVLTGVQVQLTGSKLGGSNTLEAQWASTLTADTSVRMGSKMFPRVDLVLPVTTDTFEPLGTVNNEASCHALVAPICPQSNVIPYQNLDFQDKATSLDPYVGETGTITAVMRPHLSFELQVSDPQPVGSLTSATFKQQAQLQGRIALTYSYLNHARPVFTDIATNSVSISFGTVLQGDNAFDRKWGIRNTGAAPNIGLDLTGIATADPDALKFDLGLGSSRLTGLDAGESRQYQATLDTAQPGTALARFQLQYADSARGAAASRNSYPLALTLSGTVEVRTPKLEAGGFDAGFQAAAPIVADLNRDAKPDLIVLDRDHEAVKVFRGLPEGGFEPKPRLETQYRTGHNPVAMALGDVDKDGRPDVVVANYNDDTVSLLRGDGAAGFAPATTLAAGSGPIAVALEDLNRDGKQDLVIADARGNQVRVMLGSGDSKFAAAQSFGAATLPYGMTVGDIDRDGKPDVAVTNPTTGRVNVLLGRGDGTFKSRTSFPVGGIPLSLTLTDIGGDGLPDLLVANHGDSVSLLSGSGSKGLFAAATTIALPAGSGPSSVAAADMNKDGHPDLLVSNLGSNSLSVMPNLGQGSFGAPLSFPVGAQPAGMAVADVNADGKSDITTVNSGDNSVSVLLNSTVIAPSGRFTVAPGSPIPTGLDPLGVALADFNRDGKPDLAATNSDTDTVSVYLGTGGGRFQNPQLFATGQNPIGLTTGDFNGDGRIDLATMNNMSGDVSVLLGTGDGQFQAAQQVNVGGTPRGLAINDYNGDGKVDLAVTRIQSPGSVAVLLGLGDGRFPSSHSYETGDTPSSVASGDLDGDGKPDLLVANFNSASVSILMGVGNGQFAPPRTLPTGVNPVSIALGDVNGDGKYDLVVATQGGAAGDIPQPPSLSVLLGAGDGTFQASQVLLPPDVGDIPNYVTLGEFNGDGKPDLVLAQHGNVSIVLTGTGEGQFVPAQSPKAAGSTVYATVGDVDNDGRLDLVTGDLFSDSSLRVLLNRAP